MKIRKREDTLLPRGGDKCVAIFRCDQPEDGIEETSMGAEGDEAAKEEREGELGGSFRGKPGGKKTGRFTSWAIYLRDTRV